MNISGYLSLFCELIKTLYCLLTTVLDVSKVTENRRQKSLDFLKQYLGAACFTDTGTKVYTNVTLPYLVHFGLDTQKQYNWCTEITEKTVSSGSSKTSENKYRKRP